MTRSWRLARRRYRIAPRGERTRAWLKLRDEATRALVAAINRKDAR